MGARKRRKLRRNASKEPSVDGVNCHCHSAIAIEKQQDRDCSPKYLYVDPGSPTKVLVTEVRVKRAFPGCTASYKNRPPRSMPPNEASNSRCTRDGNDAGGSWRNPAKLRCRHASNARGASRGVRNRRRRSPLSSCHVGGGEVCAATPCYSA